MPRSCTANLAISTVLQSSPAAKNLLDRVALTAPGSKSASSEQGMGADVDWEALHAVRGWRGRQRCGERERRRSSGCWHDA